MNTKMENVTEMQEFVYEMQDFVNEEINQSKNELDLQRKKAVSQTKICKTTFLQLPFCN